MHVSIGDEFYVDYEDIDDPVLHSGRTVKHVFDALRGKKDIPCTAVTSEARGIRNECVGVVFDGHAFKSDRHAWYITYSKLRPRRLDKASISRKLVKQYEI